MSTKPWKIWRRGNVFYVTTPDGRRVSLHTRDRAKAIAKRDKLKAAASSEVPTVEEPPAIDVPPGASVAGDSRPDDPLTLVGADEDSGTEAAPGIDAETDGAAVGIGEPPATVADVATQADIDAAAEEMAFTAAALGCWGTAFGLRWLGIEAGEPSEERARRLVAVWKRITRQWVGSGEVSPWLAIAAAHIGAVKEQIERGRRLPPKDVATTA